MSTSASAAPPAATWDAIRAALARDRAGMHQLAPPARVLDAALPAPLAEMYRCFDGASLFHDALALAPSARARRDEDRWWVGELAGDDIYLDARGHAVWRLEKDTGEWVEEGTSLARWLLGAIEAEAALYDADGEFLDVFDEDGELSPDAAVRVERRRLDRDPRAPGPRWRLARALARRGEAERARAELEEVVALRPGFGWAWYDLARLSEQLATDADGLRGALDEARQAAEVSAGYEHVALFWATAARLAERLGDEAQRAECARRALDSDPDMARAQRDGARASLDAGDVAAARELVELAGALAPRERRDLALLDLHARIRAAEAALAGDGDDDSAATDTDTDDDDSGADSDGDT